jgi:hypothetical protein
MERNRTLVPAVIARHGRIAGCQRAELDQEKKKRRKDGIEGKTSKESA